MSELTQTQVDEALRYNRARGYSRSQIDEAQRQIGVPVSGFWDYSTVHAVAVWQEKHHLDVDGKVGPGTWHLMHEHAVVAQPVSTTSARRPVIGLALAAYDQEWPGHTPAEAMQVAYDAAVAAGATEVRYWSSEWLIDDMGGKGNHYSEPFLKSLSPTVPLGAYIDDPVSVVKKPEYARRLRDMHITRASLMVNRSNAQPGSVPWVLRYTLDDLARIAENFDAVGIERVLTGWMQPAKTQIDAACEFMDGALDLVGAYCFEIDQEGNWKPEWLRGFSTMNDAGKYLIHSMRRVARGKKLGLSTYTYHTENSPKAILAPEMDILLPQAYSVRHRENSNVEWTDSLGPGRHQRLAMALARQAAAA